MSGKPQLECQLADVREKQSEAESEVSALQSDIGETESAMNALSSAGTCDELQENGEEAFNSFQNITSQADSVESAVSDAVSAAN